MPTTSSYAGTICPNVSASTGVSISGTTGCNFIITFNSNGSITTSGPGGYYDAGGDDALVGVVNDKSTTISSFSLTATDDIFGFDGDGIGSYTGVTNAKDTSDGNYGGADAYFTNITGVDGPGTVNFITPVAANGGTQYFSLENAINLSAPPVVGSGVPEPSTWAMMLLGFAGLGFAGYRKVRPSASNA